MGGSHSKPNKKSNHNDNPSLTHYKKSKPEFVIENVPLSHPPRSSGSCYSFFSCFQVDNRGLENGWKVLFLNRCTELEKVNFWAEKFKRLLKKFKQTVPDEDFLEQFKDIEYPNKVLTEKKEMEWLENSAHMESINNNNVKNGLINSSDQTMVKTTSENYHKKIKKILSTTVLLDDHFQEDIFQADFMRATNSNNNMPVLESKNSNMKLMLESRTSNKYLEDYKARRFSFEDSKNTKGSFPRGRNSLDNTKETFHFKNNTFVIDYQTFLNNMSNAGEMKSLKTEEKYMFINHYKLVTDIIERQLKNQQSPLGYLFICFRNIFEKEFENKLILYNKDHKDKYAEIYDDVVVNVKDMIKLMTEGLFMFYNLKKYKDESQSIFLFTKDNVINFMTSVVFENDYVYDYLFTLQKDVDVFREISIRRSMEKMKHFKPVDFGINERISLNKDTISFFKSLDPSGKSMKQSDDLTMEFFQPYKKAVKNLKLIENVRSPMHKLKIILKCAESIIKSIRRFYEKNDKVFSENISGDEILTIFIYIINKANVPFLISHCNLIEKFITNQLSFSISGYYFSTIMAALSFIENGT